jgi:hypothetical protein
MHGRGTRLGGLRRGRGYGRRGVPRSEGDGQDEGDQQEADAGDDAGLGTRDGGVGVLVGSHATRLGRRVVGPRIEPASSAMTIHCGRAVIRSNDAG